MKYLVFWMLMLSCILNVQAANIYDLDLGDGVYLQGFLSDELVYVRRIDIRNNRVKIWRRNDGTTKWIGPSKLISREASTINDVGRTAIGIGIAVCILNPGACKNTSNSH